MQKVINSYCDYISLEIVRFPFHQSFGGNKEAGRLSKMGTPSTKRMLNLLKISNVNAKDERYKNLIKAATTQLTAG